jgi:hypothetical protein
VDKAGFVAEASSNQVTDVVELTGLNRQVSSAGVAEQIFAASEAAARIEPGTVPEMHMADQAEALERFEVPIEGPEVRPAAQTVRQAVRGQRLVRLPKSLEQ